MRTHEPPTIPIGSPLSLRDRYPEIYPGVRGWAVEITEGVPKGGTPLIHIPMVWGKGDGQVGKMLDELSPRCRIVNVLNARLEGMLERRGWIRGWMEDEDFGRVDVWKPPEDEHHPRR